MPTGKSIVEDDKRTWFLDRESKCFAFTGTQIRHGAQDGKRWGRLNVYPVLIGQFGKVVAQPSAVFDLISNRAGHGDLLIETWK